MIGSGRKKGIKYPIVILLGFSLLCISTNAFSQTATREEKAEHRAEKRKEIKHFFKKLNPFKKDKGDASTETQTTQAVPAPSPVVPDNSKSTTTTTKKAKKTAKPKTEKGVQPLI